MAKKICLSELKKRLKIKKVKKDRKNSNEPLCLIKSIYVLTPKNQSKAYLFS